MCRLARAKTKSSLKLYPGNRWNEQTTSNDDQTWNRFSLSNSRASFFLILVVFKIPASFLHFFHNPIKIIVSTWTTQIEKSVDFVLEIWTYGLGMVGADGSTEWWRYRLILVVLIVWVLDKLMYIPLTLIVTNIIYILFSFIFYCWILLVHFRSYRQVRLVCH